MSLHRKNTLVLDFSVLPQRPTMEQVEEFIKGLIKVDMGDVKNIQINSLKRCVYIEMNDAGVAPRLQKHHHLRHWFIVNGVNYYVPVYVDCPTTIVRVHDLPPQMSNNVISKSLEQYGKVLSIQNEVWVNFFPGIPNGVRVVKMKMDKPMPSHIVVENHTTLVSYPKTSQKSVRGDKETQSASSTGEAQKNESSNQCGTNDSPSNESDTSDNHDDDGNDNDDSSINDDNESSKSGETEKAEFESGKRRLSTASSNETKEENQSKKPCSQGDQKSSDERSDNNKEWKVYNTRSRKKQ